MKVEEVREMSPEERLRKLDDLRQELFNLRFQHEIGQLENSSMLKRIKRDIARTRTVIREAELSQEQN